MATAAQNILIIHPAGLGQTTLALPALRSLRQHLPHSYITVVTSAEAADLLRLVGGVDEVLPVGRLRPAEMIAPPKLYRSARSFGQLRRSHYDVAVEFKTGLATEILLRLAQPGARLSQPKGKLRELSAALERVKRNLGPLWQTHLAHEYLRKLEPLGVRPIEAEPKLASDRQADEQLEKLLRKRGVAFGELLVGIHPGAGRNQPRWPLERFTSVAARLIHNFNARALVFAGPDERGWAKRLAAQLPAQRSIVFEAPKIPALLAACARLSVFVANHSGPAHVAAAVGAPVVVVSPSPQATPQDVLNARGQHVRGANGALISEEAVYETACRLLQMNRAEFLRMR